jgi:hypothetical protein
MLQRMLLWRVVAVGVGVAVAGILAHFLIDLTEKYVCLVPVFFRLKIFAKIRFEMTSQFMIHHVLAPLLRFLRSIQNYRGRVS